MPGILNALGNAATGLATIGGVTTQGGLPAPSVVVSNFAVPGIPLVSFRDYFLTSLESWFASIPLRTQFIVLIESFPDDLNTAFLQQLEPTKGDKKAWDIDKGKTVLTSYPFQSVVGCLFVDGASLPTENLSVEAAIIPNNRGFIQGGVLTNREAFTSNTLTIQIRETNTSFVDVVMRPWVILAAHRGFIATLPGQSSVKTNITIIQYAKTFQNVSQIPRKVWKYYNCTPLSVDTRNLTYDKEDIESYDVSFLYDTYTIENNLYIPLPDIISKIGKGNIPRISPLQR
jgi:hypothetical protein